MIDHILAFADEATAQKALPQFYTAPTKTDPGAWDQSRCIPGVLVYTVTGTTTNAQGDVIETRNYASGWRINVALPAIDKSLSAELVLDRDAAAAGQPFVIASVYAPDVLAGMTFSPVYAGSKVADRVAAVKQDVTAAKDAPRKTAAAQVMFKPAS